MNKILYISLISILSFFSIFSFSKNKNIIHYSGLGNSHLVIGSLGEPLGKIITIEGIIIDGDDTRMKENSGKLLLKVELVNGNKLKKSVTIDYRTFNWAKVKDMTVNKRFKYIGYESGDMTGIPYDAFKYIPMVATRSYGFSVYFQICKELE